MADGYLSNEDHEPKADVDDTCVISATENADIPFTQGEIKIDETPAGDVPKIEDMDNKKIPEDSEDISVESFQSLLNSLINAPALYCGTWWIRTPEQTDIFAKELYIYCQKKSINIRDYMFDELPLLMVGAQLAGGLYNDYKKHAEIEKIKKKEEKKIDVNEGRLPGYKEHTEEKEKKEE